MTAKVKELPGRRTRRLTEVWASEPEGLEPVMWSKPDKQGELRKQGHFVKSWKTRWFVLQQDKLFYFKNRTVWSLSLCWRRKSGGQWVGVFFGGARRRAERGRGGAARRRIRSRSTSFRWRVRASRPGRRR